MKKIVEVYEFNNNLQDRKFDLYKAGYEVERYSNKIEVLDYKDPTTKELIGANFHLMTRTDFERKIRGTRPDEIHFYCGAFQGIFTLSFLITLQEHRQDRCCYSYFILF